MADQATHLRVSSHLSCERDQIKMKDYMDRRVTPPKWVTMPTWGPPPPCKQALKVSSGVVNDMTCATMLASLSKYAHASSR